MLSSLLLAAGCVQDMVEPDMHSGNGTDGETVTLTFTPHISGNGPSTKAMADQPAGDIHNIYFAVFDEHGYKLSEYAEAVPNSKAQENGHDYEYSVELKLTEEKRIIHIIANAPKKLVFGSEAETMGALASFYDASETDGDWSTAYWGRIELDGVYAAPNTKDHGAVGSPSYNAQKAKYKAVMDALSSVKLIRNFARIVVLENVADFELHGFYLTNFPDRGSFAPYNRSTQEFQGDYADYDTFDDLIDPDQGNYNGFTPATATIVNIAGNDEVQEAQRVPQLATQQADGSMRAQGYCYERETPKSEPLYVIAYGRYSGDANDTYYKIDIRDNSGNYFPILRNLSYNISIKTVSRSGYATIEDAIAAPPSGDVSSSLDLQDLTNISSGTARLFVNETNSVIVSNAPVQLRYKFIPDLQTAKETAANSTNPGDTGNGYVVITTTNGDTGAVFTDATIQPDKATDETDGYRVITLHPNTPSGVARTQTITITGHNKTTGETLVRTVEFHLRSKLQMKATCTQKIPQDIGEEVEVRIGLEEGLPSSIFSLNFLLEAEGLTLSSVEGSDALPVNTEISEHTHKPTYIFTKSISWSDYLSADVESDGYKYFTCRFRTNKNFTGRTGDTIHISNEYFEDVDVSFTTYPAQNFTSLTFGSIAIVGQNVTVNYAMSAVPAGGKVLVGLSGFEPADGETKLIPATPRVNSEGLDMYEMNASTSGSFDLAPYVSGQGLVKLYADEYRPIQARTIINEYKSQYVVWADVDRIYSERDWITLPGIDLTGENNLIVGQTGKLTIYIKNVNSGTVTIGGQPATRVTSGTGQTTTTPEGAGKTYYAWEADYTAPEGDAQVARVDVVVDGFKAVTMNVPVYGIKVFRNREVKQAVRGSFSTTEYYVIQNQTGNYITNANPNLSPVLSAKSLLQFGSTSQDNNIIFVNAATRAVKYLTHDGANNGDPTIEDVANPTRWRFQWPGGNAGMRIYYEYLIVPRYLYDKDGVMGIQNGSPRNRNWHIYPVTFVAPK